MHKLLIVKPVLNDHCDPTKEYFEVISHSLSMPLKHEMADADVGYDIIELDGYHATRDGLQMILAEDKDITDVAFFTHGHSAGLWAVGQGLLPCIDANNIHYLKGKGAYFVCCHGGRSLSQAAVAAGAKYFIGFKSKVYLGGRKMEWIIAGSVLYALRRILTGMDPVEAWELMQKHHALWIEKLRRRAELTDDPEWDLGASMMDYNKGQLMLQTASEKREGVSILRNPTSVKDLTPEEFERALTALRRWVQDPKTMPFSPIGTAGTSAEEDLSPARILRVIEDRKAAGKLGVGDPPEMLLVQLAKRKS